MSSLPQSYLSPEEYLEIERRAEFKSEYFVGEMFAMAGTSPRHNIICVNTSSELRVQLRGRPCRTYANDLRVKIIATGLYTYPDVVVVCGEQVFDDVQPDTLLNPTVIVEVLSPSTELYDRSKKFAQYERLESVKDYVLIAQDKTRVEHFTREGAQQWLLTAVDDLTLSVRIASIDCVLALSAIYEDVDFVPDMLA